MEKKISLSKIFGTGVLIIAIFTVGMIYGAYQGHAGGYSRGLIDGKSQGMVEMLDYLSEQKGEIPENPENPRK